MITLYFKENCPYCHKVRDFAAQHGIQLELKDIHADPAILDELVARGGKQQVPYLVDADRGVEMYESDDIVRYLEEQYVH